MSDKPVAKFSGADGNVFNLLNIAKTALKRSNRENKLAEIKEMSDKVFKSHSYAEALGIMSEYVEVE